MSRRFAAGLEYIYGQGGLCSYENKVILIDACKAVDGLPALIFEQAGIRRQDAIGVGVDGR